MKSNQHAISVFLSFLITFPLLGAGPLGQIARYQVDHDSSRTSSMIQDGTVVAAVTEYNEKAQGGPAYQVTVDYDFHILLAGDQHGTQNTWLDAQYFTQAFLDKLRKDGQYSGPNFKATHQGYEDATNLDGHFYPHCDKVLLYDLKQRGQQSPFAFFEEILELAAPSEERGDIQNLHALAHIYPGIPVLGAVKLDLSGVYNGLPVKAGGDYQAP